MCQEERKEHNMSIYNIIVEFTFYYTQIFISELFSSKC